MVSVSLVPKLGNELSDFFYIDYVNKEKDDNSLLVTAVRSYIGEKYPKHLKIYADGSLLKGADL